MSYYSQIGLFTPEVQEQKKNWRTDEEGKVLLVGSQSHFSDTSEGFSFTDIFIIFILSLYTHVQNFRFFLWKATFLGFDFTNVILRINVSVTLVPR